MNEIDELITAMLVVTFAAVMLVAGELYIKRRPVQAHTKAAAVAAAEKAIERALAVKKVRLVPPQRSD